MGFWPKHLQLSTFNNALKRHGFKRFQWPDIGRAAHAAAAERAKEVPAVRLANELLEFIN